MTPGARTRHCAPLTPWRARFLALQPGFTGAQSGPDPALGASQPLGRFPRDSPNISQAVGCRGECDTVPVPVPTDEPAGTTLQDAEAMGRVLTP